MNNNLNIEKQIYLTLSSKNKLFYFYTKEEEIVLEAIRKYCNKESLECLFFRPSTGFVVPSAEIHGDSFAKVIADWSDTGYLTNKLLILIDFNEQLAKIENISALKYLLSRKTNCQIALISSELNIPSELISYTSVCKVKGLSEDEIRCLINKNYPNSSSELIKRIKDNPKEACLGLSSFEIIMCINEALVFGKSMKEQAEYFWNKRTEFLRADAKLDIIKTDNLDFDDIGGYQALKVWVNGIHNVEKELMPKGMLLVGIPGCGKSLSVKIVAKQVGLPLLRLDFAQIMDMYVGNSEKNLIKALNRAEQVAPCLLWFDEFEKSFGKGSDSDSSISQRLLAYILTWMQENESRVFVAATVNNIAKLPPELLRRGRFDKIYFVDFPSLGERKEIIKILSKKYGLKLDEEFITDFAEQLNNYSGADIEYIIKETMRRNSKNIKELKGSSLLDELLVTARITPSVEKVMSEDIRKMRDEFMHRRFENVSGSVAELDTTEKKSLFETIFKTS